MSEPIIEPERVGKNTQKKVIELEAQLVSLAGKVEELTKTSKGLLKAIQLLESETGDAYMPIGTYLGVKFDE